MNIQQFQYILAVEELKHFETAAERCFITQSTLSTMISRFEDEIGIQVFNRKTKPVSVTKEGKQIVDRLRIITKEIDQLNNVAQELKGEMIGDLRIGIIPTVAPYLLPIFLSKFASEFPKVKIIIQEMTTSKIQQSLKDRTLDIGILATPLEETELIEFDLYSEPFLVYDSYSLEKKDTIAIQDLDYSKLWFLEEGHCLRTQVQQICEISNKRANKNLNFEFKAGSLDSLLRFTKANKGITILPYLASFDLSHEDKNRLTPFSSPVPVRSIGLITHRHFVKKALLNRLQKLIQKEVDSMLPKILEATILKPV
jgi:LysR family hydrogen peroxide-inducible transcriptional activator